MQPWTVTTQDGSVRLRFEPVAAHDERIDLKVLRSLFIQPVGHFSGEIDVDGPDLRARPAAGCRRGPGHRSGSRGRSRAAIGNRGALGGRLEHRTRVLPVTDLQLAVIPGDGIGTEVVAEGLKVLDAVAPSAGLSVTTTEYDLGARRYNATGETLPASVLAELRGHDAILLGAIGDPSVPPGVLERGVLLPLRFELDHHVNLRPVKLFPGVATPLAGKGPAGHRHGRLPRGHRGPVRRLRRDPAQGHRRTRWRPRRA